MKIEYAALVVLVPIVLLLILVGLGSAVILAFMDAVAALLPKSFM
jgi:Flp pilus assembly pilin Flp